MIFKKTENTKYLIWFWSIFAGSMLCLAVFFVLLSSGALGFMPTFEELENPKSNLATDVISADDVVLGKIFQENRSQVDYDDLSPYLVKALVSTEDERFFEHSGVDVRSLGRVLVRTVMMRDESSGGGSTITQQLAKLLFHGHAQSKWERVSQKLKEWVIAVKLERSYTKEEILTMYLNKAAFIYDAYGIESASWTFFGVSASKLKVEQAAVLVGMLKNPALYNPVRRPEQTLRRRNVVLGQMLRARHLSQSEFDSLRRLPLELTFNRADNNEGLAPYFREYIRLTMSASKPRREHYPDWMEQRYVEDSTQWIENPLYGWIEKNPKADGSRYNIYRDGLKIYTTIDSRMQRYAEQSLEEHLGGELQPKFFASKKGQSRAPYSSNITREQYDAIISRAVRNSDRYRIMKQGGFSQSDIDKAMHTPTEMKVFSWAGERDTVMTPYDSVVYHKFFLRAGMMAVEPHTGHIKVYIGGPNYKYFKYDMVTQGKRQVGSTIKPFVYALAMQEGHTPCDLVPNVPQTFVLPEGGTWTPRNTGSARAGEMVSLKWGLANSNNNITAWVMKQYSPAAVAEMIHDLGIKSPVDAVPSLCLGTSDIGLYEMVGAYNTFASKGVYVEPLAVTRIEDRFGNVIAQFESRKREAISAETAFLMINLLEGVINQGTGRRLRGPAYQFTSQMGGKTGTTQNHSDGWFMSLLPHLVTGVWVGGEDRDIHFESMSLGQASNMAIPVFGRFLGKVYADPSIAAVRPDDVFEEPEYFGYTLDCSDRNVNADESEAVEPDNVETDEVFFNF